VVTGANSAEESVFANSKGEAQFCYTGTHAGEDTISGSVGLVSGTAKKTWTEGPPKQAAPLSAGYWKTHQTKGSPNTKQYLPQSIGNYKVDTTEKAGAIFSTMTCSNSSSQNAIGCLAGQLLATELNLA